MLLERLHATSFTWSRWRSFNLFEEFKIPCRYSELIKNKSILSRYAIGYIEAEKLICRPKRKHYAIMFFKDDIFSWCHLSDKEFIKIFN